MNFKEFVPRWKMPQKAQPTKTINSPPPQSNIYVNIETSNPPHGERNENINKSPPLPKRKDTSKDIEDLVMNQDNSDRKVNPSKLSVKIPAFFLDEAVLQQPLCPDAPDTVLPHCCSFTSQSKPGSGFHSLSECPACCTSCREPGDTPAFISQIKREDLCQHDTKLDAFLPPFDPRYGSFDCLSRLIKRLSDAQFHRITGPTWNSKSKQNSKRKMTRKDWFRFHTHPCANWDREGHCRYGNKCMFAHGQEDTLERLLFSPLDERKSDRLPFFKTLTQNYED
ncbi:hypothetical protein BLNAU_12277 [Blattamonas nauphoetae]|uniref:C3H1-type domain-containing protein n=1 Tax=Blattamonas nauphoetae TaxID=2049346 RepID=A0ABQ9XPT4_9EUKA|nr:hypothetical protein BLNAU_12277 [Blattamonas nauphoetae]